MDVPGTEVAFLAQERVTGGWHTVAVTWNEKRVPKMLAKARTRFADRDDRNDVEVRLVRRVITYELWPET